MKCLCDIKIFPLGDSAINVRFHEDINLETHLRIKSLCEELDKNPFVGMIEYVPAYTSLTIFYDSYEVWKKFCKGSNSAKQKPFNVVENFIVNIINKTSDIINNNSRIIEIPVCYGGGFGPDLEYVAEYNSLSTQEVVKIHTEYENKVYMIGFAPGFPYLAGMSHKIATPRKESPRLKIPFGAVGIAGIQTGIYPIDSPGGWQLIGRTPLKLFTPESDNPCLLRTGDIVKFKAISIEEYHNCVRKDDKSEYCYK